MVAHLPGARPTWDSCVLTYTSPAVTVGEAHSCPLLLQSQGKSASDTNSLMLYEHLHQSHLNRYFEKIPFKVTNVKRQPLLPAFESLQ